MRIAVFVLLACIVIPTVGAQPPATARDAGGSGTCGGPVPNSPCGAYARVNWTMEACDAAGCVVRVEASAVGWSQLPGALRLEALVLGEDLGCPHLVTPVLYDSRCARLCDAAAVLWVASCQGVRRPRVALDAGECSPFVVVTRFANEATGSTADVVFFTDACRDEHGAPFFRQTPRA